jgi:hypothetical protein
MSNPWCRAAGLEPPRLEAVAHHREANTFALLLVALLERGAPMSLAEVAARFEEAGVTDRASALLALQRCKPGRAPVYREGDFYHLDPYDAELDLWAFRLGLRLPRVAPLPPQRAVEPSPLPGPDIPLGEGELDEAWTDASLFAWSARRLVVAVLDAHGGPLAPAEVAAAVLRRTKWQSLGATMEHVTRSGGGVLVLPDGRWTIAADAGEIVRGARAAVRELVARARQRAALRPDPALLAQLRANSEQRRAELGAAMARMSRALLVAFSPQQPQAAALLDIAAHEITTYVGDELAVLRSRLAAYDILGGIDVRRLLRALDLDPGGRRLAELGPPQKTLRLNQRGRTLKITTAMLVQGSCGIGKPFGEATKLAECLAKGELSKLRRRLEADVKSLHALYQYGRLHGAVRLRWGFLDELIPAPWVHRDEPRLYTLMQSALAANVPLEIVVGSAPGWDEPWARRCIAYVEKDADGWRTRLIDELGFVIPEVDVQRARLAVSLH